MRFREEYFVKMGPVSKAKFAFGFLSRKTEGMKSLKFIFQKKMMFLFVLGISSGLPLLLTGGTLKIWMARENLDMKTIGFFSWVGLFYSLKFLWAPFVDYFWIDKLGRRKTWILISQVMIAIGLLGMSLWQQKISIVELAIFSLWTSFWSATQDLSIDALRREVCEDKEIGMGSAFGVYGYRIAMIMAGGLGIGLVGSSILPISWGELYIGMSVLMIVLMIPVLFFKEAKVVQQKLNIKNLWQIYSEPLKSFFQTKNAIWILAFVFTYKLGDLLAGSLLNPFYVQIGYSNADIGLIAKTFGVAAFLVGLFIGGILLNRLGIIRALWLFGFMQLGSILSFMLLTVTGPSQLALGAVVFLEDISTGMGTAAFVAFLSTVSQKKFTATQFALLSSIASLGRVFFSGWMGEVQVALGWNGFFLFCTAVAVPGMLVLIKITKLKQSPV